MDREQGKRKAAESSEIKETQNIPGPSKMRKMDPPETTSAQPTVQTQISKQPETRSNEGLGNSDLVKKLVAAWIGDSQEQHPLMAQESTREIIALRDCQQRCSEAGSMIQSFQQKIEAMGAVIGNLKKDLKNEEKEKINLVKEINATGQLTTTISDHINYINDTLSRCKQQKDHFSHLYTNIVLKQKRDDATLKKRVKKLQEQLIRLQKKVVSLDNYFITSRITDEKKSTQMQRTYEVDLTKTRGEYENSKKQLETLTNEKNELVDLLVIASEATLVLKKKIDEYKAEVKNLTEQVTRVSDELRLLGDEKSQWGVKLAEKDSNFVKAVENLETATRKINELSAEILAITRTKNELEAKLKYESNEREILSTSLHNQLQNLTHQIEHLKDSDDEDSMEIRKRHEKAIDEMEKKKKEALDEVEREAEKAVEDMQKKLDTLRKNKEQLVAKRNKDDEDLKQNFERLLKVQEEKYTDCIAEKKTMEARHKCELSRANTSSSTTLANANAEKRKMERELDTLRSEKERLEVQYQQAEDSLMRVTESERELQRNVDQSQSQASQIADTLAQTNAEKKSLDDEKRKQICKIKELEKELDNLHFNNSKIATIQASNAKSVVNTDRSGKGNSQKPKIVASTTLKKPILKYTTKPRRTRSSPPSPVLVQPPSDENKSIRASELEKSADSNIMTPNSESLFDELIAMGTHSASQPTRASPSHPQVSLSQVSAGGLRCYQRRSKQTK